MIIADRAAQKLGPRPRRVAAALIIASLHLLALAWLNAQTVSSPKTSTFIVDLSLEPSEGGGAYMEPQPKLRPSTDQKDPVESAEAKTTKPAAKDETIKTADRPAETSIAETAVTPNVEAADPAVAAKPSDAVLAIVESILGTTGAELSTTAVIVEAGPAPAVTPGGGCDIGASLANAIGADTGMQDTLATLPREARSVANAVQVWDGAWIKPDDARAEPAFAAVRVAILEAIEAAPEACRSQPLTGPRFVIVPEGESAATILVVGSGTWRWSDLREPHRFIWPPWFSRRK